MTDPLPITWPNGEPDPRIESLMGSARRCFLLEKVLCWMREKAGGTLVDVVVQDEYTHDVVIELDGLWAVFDTT